MAAFKLIAPTAGVISTIFVDSGSLVAKDDVILHLELNKMFFEVRAPVDGRVTILFPLGTFVNTGDKIIRLETPPFA